MRAKKQAMKSCSARRGADHARWAIFRIPMDTFWQGDDDWQDHSSWQKDIGETCISSWRQENLALRRLTDFGERGNHTEYLEA